jgi:tRNA threonylcarbamoyladenosine biosynthesis protein TsaB
MSYILNIDTSTETAHASVAKNGKVLYAVNNNQQKDHAAFLQPGIQQIIKEAGITLAQLDAVAIAAGPGSYTGLRVGMASAKGLCFALNKPLISLNTLQVMAAAAQLQQNEKNSLYCPMIDARRMEVFTALYNAAQKTVMEPCALILQSSSFHEYLNNHRILFFGNGSTKGKNTINHSNALFVMVPSIAEGMAHISYQHLLQAEFCNLAYTEPFYLKEFKDGV